MCILIHISYYLLENVQLRENLICLFLGPYLGLGDNLHGVEDTGRFVNAQHHLRPVEIFRKERAGGVRARNEPLPTCRLLSYIPFQKRPSPPSSAA